jgi:outer membrane protein TolC
MDMRRRFQKISLEEAIDLSIKNNKPCAQPGPRGSGGGGLISKQNQLPDLKVSGSYLRLTQPNITMAKSGNSGGSPSEPAKIDQAAYGIVNLSLPVYSGLKIQYGIHSSEFLEKAAVLDAVQDKDAVIMNTIDAFSNLYKPAQILGDPGKSCTIAIP